MPGQINQLSRQRLSNSIVTAGRLYLAALKYCRIMPALAAITFAEGFRATLLYNLVFGFNHG
jgi:hypothetical protein